MRQTILITVASVLAWGAFNAVIALWLHRVRRPEPRRVTTISFGDRSEAI